MEVFRLSLEYHPLPHAGVFAHPRRDALTSGSSVVPWRGLLSSLCLCFAQEQSPSSYSSFSPPQNLKDHPFVRRCLGGLSQLLQGLGMVEGAQLRLSMANPVQRAMAARL